MSSGTGWLPSLSRSGRRGPVSTAKMLGGVAAHWDGPAAASPASQREGESWCLCGLTEALLQAEERAGAELLLPGPCEVVAMVSHALCVFLCRWMTYTPLWWT